MVPNIKIDIFSEIYSMVFLEVHFKHFQISFFENLEELQISDNFHYKKTFLIRKTK